MKCTYICIYAYIKYKILIMIKYFIIKFLYKICRIELERVKVSLNFVNIFLNIY